MQEKIKLFRDKTVNSTLARVLSDLEKTKRERLHELKGLPGDYKLRDIRLRTNEIESMSEIMKKKINKLFKRDIPISSVDGSPMPEEAIKGLTNALEDVKEGRYETFSSDDLCECGHERGEHNYIGCLICECEELKQKING